MHLFEVNEQAELLEEECISDSMPVMFLNEDANNAGSPHSEAAMKMNEICSFPYFFLGCILSLHILPSDRFQPTILLSLPKQLSGLESTRTSWNTKQCINTLPIQTFTGISSTE